MPFYKYTLKNLKYAGITYEVIDSKTISNISQNWINSLTYNEIAAFKKYRQKINISKNINAQIRSGNTPKEAIIMSNALSRSIIQRNIIVYRNLSTQENNLMRSKKPGTNFTKTDFTGTHVRKSINVNSPLTTSSGYMIILIPANSNVAYINDLTIFFRYEKELLIDRNSTYRLISIFNIQQKYIYIVKLIN